MNGDAHADLGSLCLWCPCPMYTASFGSSGGTPLVAVRLSSSADLLLGTPTASGCLSTSRPRAIACGIIAHCLKHFGSIAFQPLRSPVLSVAGSLGALRAALPVRAAHQLTETATWKTRQAEYSASSLLG